MPHLRTRATRLNTMLITHRHHRIEIAGDGQLARRPGIRKPGKGLVFQVPLRQANAAWCQPRIAHKGSQVCQGQRSGQAHGERLGRHPQAAFL